MLRRLFSYMGRYKKYAFLALFCIAVESVFELLVPLIMADLVDVGVASGDRAYIFQKGGEMVICGVLALILGVGSARFAALAGRDWEPGSVRQNMRSFRNILFPTLTISGVFPGNKAYQ